MKPPENYRTVKQPKDMSICGACLVAMITGLDLKLVQANMVYTNRDDRLYYKEKEIIEYLVSLGVYIGIRAIPLENPLHPDQNIEFKWPLKGNPAILAVKSKVYDDADHWVFWDGHHVRDSSWINKDETSKLQNYEVLEIIPIFYSEDYDFIPPSGDKLHGKGCPCMSCTIIRMHNQRNNQVPH